VYVIINCITISIIASLKLHQKVNKLPPLKVPRRHFDRIHLRSECSGGKGLES
ncbi:hypothetical protein PanWU01x14_158760, partial [Parasponia andersonii]